MKNYHSDGMVLSFPAPAGGVVSGQGYIIGTIFGVAVGTAAAAADFQLNTCGVYELPKLRAQAWTAGQKIYWDADAAGGAEATSVAANNHFIGFAAEVPGNPSNTGLVRLNGVSI